MSLTPWSERRLEVRLKGKKADQESLGLAFTGQPFQAVVPWKPHRVRVKEFSDVVFEFEVDAGRVKALKQIDPSGENRLPRE